MHILYSSIGPDQAFASRRRA